LYHRRFRDIKEIMLDYASHTLTGLRNPAIKVQSKRAEIFQVGKINTQNWKMIDIWGNAKMSLPRHF
jgi:hypothetical protein